MHPYSLFAPFFLSAQNEKSSFGAEIYISVNRSLIHAEGSSNATGYGIGILQSFRKDKAFDILFGIELNSTGQMRDYVYAGKFANKRNVSFRFLWLSIPMNARINFGKNTKYFVDFGPFVDFPIWSQEEGTLYSCIPENGNGPCESTENEFKSSVSGINTNFGFTFGFGVAIPISAVKLVIRSDYKLGMRTIYEDQNSLTNNYIRLNIGIRF